MITGFIKGQALQISSPVIVASSIDYLEAKFAFQTGDWNDLEKWAHFTCGGVSHVIRLKDDKIGREMHLNLFTGIWKVYIHGTGKSGMRITTNEAELTVRPTGAENDEVFPTIPPSVAEQIAADATEAKEIAVKLRDDAENGRFDGASITVSNVTESTADGGSNVVTFSDGKTLTVKNGSKGSTGDKGDKGDKGDTGDKGADGITPHVGENGNWWIGDTDTGVSVAPSIVQTTGDSKTAVMSQKATTAEIKGRTEIEGKFIETDITDSLDVEMGFYYSKDIANVGKATGTAAEGCTGLIPVQEGDFFKITSTYGYFRILVAEFDSEQTYISYNGQVDGQYITVNGYEYTVPSGVSYIAINNVSQSSRPMSVKKCEPVTIKEELSKLKEEVTGLSIYAENGIVGGNFSKLDGWAAVGGTLSASNGAGIVTADKSGYRVGISAKFGEYEQGDKVFFKANILAPYGEGGSTQQNQVYIDIYNNSSTGLKYAVQNRLVADLERRDYYGVIEFDGAYFVAPTFFIATYINAQYIPNGAKVEFRDIMGVNLTKAFGAGNEPTADEFYALLDGFDNRWFDGEVDLFSPEAEARRIYDGSALTKDIIVTVGKNGDFLTLNGAIEHLSHYYPVYKKGGINCNIKILAGTVINEQIYANQIDLQYITITAEAGDNNTETISIDGVSHTMVIVDVDASGFGVTANAHDARGNYPFIAGENAAKLPTIGCLFRLLPDTVEEGKTVCGMLCNRGSEGVVLAASGFDGFNDGCIANNESSITIREGVSRNMTRWGVHARHNGEVSARSCVCTNCGIAAYADRVADLDVREAVLDGSTVAIMGFNTSRVNANGANITGGGSNSEALIQANGGSVVNCIGINMNDIADSITVYSATTGGTVVTDTGVVGGVEIVQETGDSETATMSQKAVTDEFNKQRLEVNNQSANALKGKASGEAIAIYDISPVEHTIDAKVRSKNLAMVNEYELNGTFINFVIYKGYINTPFCLSWKQDFVSNNGAAIFSVRTIKSGEYVQSIGDRKDAQSPYKETIKPTSEEVEVLIVNWAGGIGNLSNIQLEVGTEPTEYKPFVDVSTVKVKAQGKNLIAYPYTDTSKTVNGVTFTDNGDGSITANGTATDANALFNLGYFELNLNTSYSLSGMNGNSKQSVFLQITVDGKANRTYDVPIVVTPSNSTDTNTLFCVKKGETVNNLTIYPQLEIGTVATEYEPYNIEPIEYTVNADGTIDGLCSIYPTTTLIADTANVIIDAEYNKDANKVVASLEDRIAALEAMIINY
jgi:hypothetical protein